MRLFDVLIGLPTRLSCSILQDWIDFKSLGTLDSACCDRVRRPSILQLMGSGELVFSSPVKLTADIIRWIVSKNICLGAVEFKGLNGMDFAVVGRHTDKVLSTESISAAQLEQVLTLCPNIRSLGLKGHTHVIENRLLGLCPHITSLSFHRCDLDDADLLRIITTFKSIHTLRLTECANLTVISLVHIYTHCADSLHTLHLQRDLRVDVDIRLHFATVTTLLRKCNRLRNLHLSECTAFVELPTFVFDFSLPNLTTLYLSGDTITDECLASVSTYCANLRHLSFIRPAPWIIYTDVGIDALASGCPFLQEVTLSRIASDTKSATLGKIAASIASWKAAKTNIVFHEIDSETIAKITRLSGPLFDFFNVHV